MTNAVPRYIGAHELTRKHRGKASEHPCEDCEGQAQHWAYDHTDPNELTDLTQTGAPIHYSADPAHYRPLCPTCHKLFDRKTPIRPGRAASLKLPPAMLAPVATLAASRRISRTALIVQLLDRELAAEARKAAKR